MSGTGTMEAKLHLNVMIPESDVEAFPAVLRLARTAPRFESKVEGAGRAYLATFPDLTQSLDLVIQLIGEMTKFSNPQATLSGRRVSSLTRFWSALLCYRESLGEPNPHDHCLRFSARLNQFGGCPDQTCLSPCQFLCTRCIGLAQGKSDASLEAQLQELARRAEVDWCPNLGFSDRLPASCAHRTS